MHGSLDPRQLRPLRAGNKTLTAIDFVATERGAVWVFEPSPSVMYTQAAGRACSRIRECMERIALRQMYRGNTVRHIHDWADMTDYDPDTAVYLTKWLMEHRRAIEGIYILASSPFVAMAISAANVGTSMVGLKLSSYRARSVFERVMPRLLDGNLVASSR